MEADAAKAKEDKRQREEIIKANNLAMELMKILTGKQQLHRPFENSVTLTTIPNRMKRSLLDSTKYQQVTMTQIKNLLTTKPKI
jgi:hypothetical protein